MGAVDVNSGLQFERRIGRRLDVAPIDVTFFVPESGRFRRKVAAHEVPGHIEDVSITGAGVIGPESLPWRPGDQIVLRFQGRDNLVVVRHRRSTGRGALFGVELTRSATGLRRRIQELLDPTLAVPAEPPAPPRPILGLRRDEPAVERPVRLPPAAPPDLSTPAAPSPDPAADPATASAEPEATVAAEPAVAPEPTVESEPTVDLSGGEAVLDLREPATPAVDAVAETTEPVGEDTAPPLEDVVAVVGDAEPELVAEPEPESLAADEDDAPEPVAELQADTDSENQPVVPQPRMQAESVAPHAPAPSLPHSPGRQVLDEVFGLMGD